MRLAEVPATCTRPSDRRLVVDVRGIVVTQLHNSRGRLRFRLDYGAGVTPNSRTAKDVWAEVDLTNHADLAEIQAGMVPLLERWHKRRTRLRWITASGKGGLLIEDNSRVLPMPRDLRKG